MKVNFEIPIRSIWSTIGLILLGGFSYLQFVGYLIPSFQKIFSLKLDSIHLQDIGLIWVPIITYGLVSVMICLVVNIFKPIKSYSEGGLISGLISGLIWGLILGLISGLIVGLISGLIVGLISGLIGGLIGGLIWGLIGGLIWGPIVGLTPEFK